MKQIAAREAWTGIADCKNCKMRQSALFAGLSEQDFSLIHAPLDQYDYKEGASIYRTGDCHNAMFTIRSGLVKLVQYLPDHSQRIVRLLHSGDLIGLECFAGDKYQHDAIALHDTRLCRLPVDDVKKLATRNPRLFAELMNRWQKTVSDADYWLTGFSTGSARQRVARLLIRLAEREGGNSCRLFSREDMGSILGITTETASRVMAQLKRERLISEQAANYFLCDMERLRAILAN